jgi:CoA-transferase family III
VPSSRAVAMRAAKSRSTTIGAKPTAHEHRTLLGHEAEPAPDPLVQRALERLPHVVHLARHLRQLAGQREQRGGLAGPPVRDADVFLEGYRPGVAERLGIGPDVLLAENPRLIHTRLTGYGQTGPYASWVGHGRARDGPRVSRLGLT